MWTFAFVLSSGSASTPGAAPSTTKYGDRVLVASAGSALAQLTRNRVSIRNTEATRSCMGGARATAMPAMSRLNTADFAGLVGAQPRSVQPDAHNDDRAAKS